MPNAALFQINRYPKFLNPAIHLHSDRCGLGLGRKRGEEEEENFGFGKLIGRTCERWVEHTLSGESIVSSLNGGSIYCPSLSWLLQTLMTPMLY